MMPWVVENVPRPLLGVGDDHNLLTGRETGDPHPQYYSRYENPLTIPGGFTVGCPMRVVTPTDPSTLAVTCDGIITMLSASSSGGGVRIGGHAAMPAGTAFVYEHQGIMEFNVGSWKMYLNPTDDQMAIGYGALPAIGASPPYRQPIHYGDRVGFEGGLAYKRREMSATGSILVNDTYIGVVAPFNGTADITLELPTAASMKSGGVIIVKDETGDADMSPGAIIVAGNVLAGDTVDGAASISIEDPLKSVFLICNGASPGNWSQFV
jgi:hypothetical protein